MAWPDSFWLFDNEWFQAVCFATKVMVFIGVLALSVQMGWMVGFSLSDRCKMDRSKMLIGILVAFIVIFLINRYKQ